MRKSLFTLLLSVAFILTGCNSSETKKEENDDESEDTRGLTINFKAESPLEVLSQKEYHYDQYLFHEMTPIFVNEHIDHFVAAPVCGYPNIDKEIKEGYLEYNVSLKTSTAGSLYFNYSGDDNGMLDKALRVELYQESTNKSVIYSHDGGETITEAKLDLDADGKIDKDMNGNEIVYTTGQHSYQTEKYNTNPFVTFEGESTIDLRMLIYIEGFATENTLSTLAMHEMNFTFEVRA